MKAILIGFKEEGKIFSAQISLPKQDSSGKVPLVVIVHEWWGRTPYIEDRSYMLNQEGFATLAVDLYGNNQTVGPPSEAQSLATPFYQNPRLGFGRLKRFVDAAKADPRVDSSRIFVIGYCFGGTQALNFARAGESVKGVVSFHGGLAAGIPANGIQARILAFNGLADPMVPAKERKAFEKEMKAAKADLKVFSYQGATHAFTNPAATEIGKKFQIPVAYNAKADAASWKELLKFLRGPPPAE